MSGHALILGALIFRGHLVIDWHLGGHQVIVFPYEKMPYLHNATFLCVIINLQRNGLFFHCEMRSGLQTIYALPEQ